MNITSERIRELREERNLSYQQLGDILGVSKSTVFRWESGETANISRATIHALSVYFMVNPLYIMGLSDEKDKLPMDAFEEDIVKRFRQLTNSQKILAYKSIDNILTQMEEHNHGE